MSEIDSVHQHGLNIHTREIFLSPIHEDEIDVWMASNFIRNLQILERENKNPILIHVCTRGGEIEWGLTIYDSILCSECYITTISYGLASSMSGIVIQAADLRILAPNTHFFIHDSQINSEGNLSTVKSDIHHWNMENDKGYDIYTRRCVNGNYFKERNCNKSKIKAYLKRKGAAGFYLSPEEAVEMGLADAVLGAEGSPYKYVKDLLK